MNNDTGTQNSEITQGWNIWNDRVEKAVYDSDPMSKYRILDSNFETEAGEENYWFPDTFEYDFLDTEDTVKGDSFFDSLEDRKQDSSGTILRGVRGRQLSETQPANSGSTGITSRRSSEQSTTYGNEEQVRSPALPPKKSLGPPYPDPKPDVCYYCKKRYPNKPWNWNNHKDIDWITGEYCCPRLARKVAEKRSNERIAVHCSYCEKANPAIADDDHAKKCPITKKVTCPVIRSLRACRHCGGFGDDAHTNNACPNRAPIVAYDK